MQYQAKVVLDTLCVDTKRRITTYPRFMTHRDRARAIPFATLSKDPVFPLQWQSAQRGMQESLDNQLRHASNLEDIGATGPCRYAGQLSDAETMPNRLIEPWMPTATEWKNFFRLR